MSGTLGMRLALVTMLLAALEIHRGRNLNEAKRLLRNYLASPITSDDPPRSEALRLVKMAMRQ